MLIKAVLVCSPISCCQGLQKKKVLFCEIFLQQKERIMKKAAQSHKQRVEVCYPLFCPKDYSTI